MLSFTSIFVDVELSTHQDALKPQPFIERVYAQVSTPFNELLRDRRQSARVLSQIRYESVIGSKADTRPFQCVRSKVGPPGAIGAFVRYTEESYCLSVYENVFETRI